MFLLVVQALAHCSDEEGIQVAMSTAAAVDAELKVGSGEATLLSHHHISSCQTVAAALLRGCKRIKPTDLHLTAALQELVICEK